MRVGFGRKIVERRKLRYVEKVEFQREIFRKEVGRDTVVGGWGIVHLYTGVSERLERGKESLGTHPCGNGQHSTS